MLIELSLLGWVTLHGLAVLVGLTIYVVGSHTLRQRRHPSAAIAWVISLVFLPYLALPLYLTIGSRKLAGFRQIQNAAVEPHKTGEAASASPHGGQLAAAMGLPAAVSFERLAVHENGAQALQSLRDMIARAEHSLDLCTFLFGRDALGDEIAMLLIQRARDGVRIRLLVDGIGFYLGGHPNLKRLSAASVQVALFVSPLQSALRGRTNLRNHRKMVVADGERLWCGGRNLAAEYFEGDSTFLRRKRAWIDLSFDLAGTLAQQAQQRFEQDWAFAAKGSIPKSQRPAVSVPTSGTSLARLVASGPDQADDTIYTLLVSGCFTAHSRVLAVTPYFVPDPTLLMALTLAARRGVAVDLLLPARSNHRLADIARYAALRELTGAGGRVWLAPTMIHAKAVLIDDDLALVGSANLDERSLFLNYELMVAFYGASVVQGFAHWIDMHKASARLYRPRSPGLMRELVEGMVRWIAFQL